MLRNKFKLKTSVQVRLDGKLVVDQPNLITNVGLAQIAGILNANQSGAARYIALGTGTSPADVANVALDDEVTFGGGERVIADRDRMTTLVENDTMRNEATFNITVGFDLTELGLLSASSDGVLYSRVVFSTVTVSADQTLVVTWTWQVTEAL